MKRICVCFATITILVAPAGCSKTAFPTGDALYATAPQNLTEAIPAATSPSNALRASAWAMNHRDWHPLSGLLTNDFRFAFAATDSAGNAFFGRTLDRDQVLLCAQHLLETGTATEPPASSVTALLDRDFVWFSDSRPGKAYPWHQETTTSATISIEAGDQEYRILGHLRFFVVRGDSAAIPPSLATEGVRPDQNRWWIERIEDETVPIMGGAPARATETLPTRAFTLGAILSLYR